MNSLYILITIFIINAGLHFVHCFIAGFRREVLPVAIFGVIYLGFGILFSKLAPPWLIWVALIISLIGISGLISQLNTPSYTSTWTDYGMLLLDVGTIFILLLKIVGYKIF